MIKSAWRICPYVGSSWLVMPYSRAVLPDTLVDLQSAGPGEIEVLAADILGWSPYNAIVRVTFDGTSGDYLAEIV